MVQRSTLTLSANLDSLGLARDFVQHSGEAARLDGEAMGNLLIAVDEAVTNIVTHGYKDAPGEINLECEHDADRFVVRLRDSAPLFNPLTLAPPDLSESPMERDAPGGFGVSLIRSLVSDVHYRATPAGHNELTLLMHLT